MKQRTTSLRRRLTALCSLLTVVAIAVIGLDSYRREQALLEHGMRTSLETLARMVAVNVKGSVESLEPEKAGAAVAAVTEFLEGVTETMGLQVAAVIAQDGTWFSVAGDSELLPEQREGTRRLGVDWVSAKQLHYRDGSGQARRSLVVVRTSGQPMLLRLREYLEGLLATMLVALLGLVLAAHWLLTRLLLPVSRLVETTNCVRRTEDYSLRAKAAANDEIGTLVRAFNAMLEVIQERDTKLARQAGRLEQQVRERTSELHRAVQAAETATRAKSTFLANMSHEIRTPLNAILGMTDLAMETEDPRELREYLGVIRDAGANLLGVLCDVLDLSKIESEKLELSLVPTELESLVLEALRPLTSRIQSKDLELTFELDPALAAAYRVDDVRVRQILTNLASNAIKFTAKGFVRVGMSLIAARDTEHDVELVVEDSGVGIPQDRLQAVFTPFTQADSTITRRFAGTGLGLSITDRLVRLMNGTIAVESTVGTGTTFRIRLPFEPCANPRQEPPRPPADSRLLVVSRSPAMVRALDVIARRLQVTAVAVDHSTRFAAVGALGPNDVVLLDERDPKSDPELAEWAKPGPRGVRPVLLTTSFQDLANASARCRANDFAGYLTKPVSCRELAARMATLRLMLTPGGTEPAVVTNDPTAAPTATRLRILVAEDNPVNQRLIERILQRDGHEVTLAENGIVCCEIFAKSEFDVVLMDMQMPELSGLDATTRIRSGEPQGRHVPIIALTANTTPEDRDACLHAGMDEVLSKPVSVPRLRTALSQLVQPRSDNASTPTGTTDAPAPE